MIKYYDPELETDEIKGDIDLYLDNQKKIQTKNKLKNKVDMFVEFPMDYENPLSRIIGHLV